MYKGAGGSYSVWEEHRQRNPGSFSTTQAKNFDDWALQSGHIQISPARVAAGQTLQHDDTAYSGAGPSTESWADQTILQHRSPAQVAATGSTRSGTLESGSGLT